MFSALEKFSDAINFTAFQNENWFRIFEMFFSTYDLSKTAMAIGSKTFCKNKYHPCVNNVLFTNIGYIRGVFVIKVCKSNIKCFRLYMFGLLQLAPSLFYRLNYWHHFSISLLKVFGAYS